MNWAYIAGFFDGEGSVFPLMHNRRTPVVELGQSRTRGLLALQEISEFLRQAGITSTVKPLTSNKGRLGKQPMYKLRVTTDAGKFLAQVLPHLRIKRSEAQDVLRFVKMYPALNNGWYIRKAAK